jgi:hypothetical protein
MLKDAEAIGFHLPLERYMRGDDQHPDAVFGYIRPEQPAPSGDQSVAHPSGRWSPQAQRAVAAIRPKSVSRAQVNRRRLRDDVA